MAPDWLQVTLNPKSTVVAQPCVCNSGVPRAATPQSVGDAAITMNPGPITGGVPAFLVIPRIQKPVGQRLQMLPQAYSVNAVRVAPRIVPGPYSTDVPYNPATQVRYYGVV